MFKKFAVIALSAIALFASSTAEARGPYGYYHYGPRYYGGGCGPACAVAAGIGGLGVGIALGTIFSQPRVEYYPQPIYVQPQPVYVMPTQPVYTPGQPIPLQTAPAPVVIERECYYSPTYDSYGRYLGNRRYCR